MKAFPGPPGEEYLHVGVAFCEDENFSSPKKTEALWLLPLTGGRGVGR